MLRRSTRALAIAIALLTVLASPALAGGWAVSTLDSTPAVFRAGESYPIGFTIRQHGVTPTRVEQYGGEVAVRVRPDGAGSPIVYPARSDGPVGHYVADVRFPDAGGWSWEVLQGPFAPQPLGALTVQPAAAPAPGPAAVPAPSPAAVPAPSLAAVRAPVLAAASASVAAPGPAPAPALAAAAGTAAAPAPGSAAASTLGPTAASVSGPVAATAPGLAPIAAPARADAAPAPGRDSPALGVILPIATLFAVASATLALAALARRPDLAAAACGPSQRPAPASGRTSRPGLPGPAGSATGLSGPVGPATGPPRPVVRATAPLGLPASPPSIALPPLSNPAV